MKRNRVILILVLLFLSFCGKEGELGSVDGQSITLDSFKKMLIDKYGFDGAQSISREEVKKMFADYYTSYALVKEAEKNQYFESEEMGNFLAKQKKDMLKKNISSVMWNKEIKPRVVNLNVESSQIKLEDFTKRIKVRYLYLQNKKDAAEKILKIKQQIVDVKSFSKMAKRYSDDLSSRQRGGDLGWIDFSDQRIKGDIKKILFSSGVGSPIGPIDSDSGFHLAWIEKQEIRSLEDVKKDQAIQSYVAQWGKLPLCKRKESKEVTYDYMDKLREKYKDKVRYDIHSLNDYFVGLAQYCKKNHPALLSDFERSSIRSTKTSISRELVSLKNFIEKENPIIIKEYNKLNENNMFYEVFGADSMSVVETVALMGPEIGKYLSDLKTLKNVLQKNFIDYDLRYLEAVSKGYQNDPKLLKEIDYRLMQVKARAYQKQLIDEFSQKEIASLSEDELKAHFNKNRSDYQKGISFSQLKDQIRRDILEKKKKEYEHVLVQSILDKQHIKINS